MLTILLVTNEIIFGEAVLFGIDFVSIKVGGEWISRDIKHLVSIR